LEAEQDDAVEQDSLQNDSAEKEAKASIECETFKLVLPEQNSAKESKRKIVILKKEKPVADSQVGEEEGSSLQQFSGD